MTDRQTHRHTHRRKGKNNMSRVVRKPAFCICENKDADQLRGNREADQRLCFRYSDSTIPLLPKSEISSFWLYSVIVQPGLCRTWSETPKTGFLRTRLICLPTLAEGRHNLTVGLSHPYQLHVSFFILRVLRSTYFFEEIPVGKKYSPG